MLAIRGVGSKIATEMMGMLNGVLVVPVARNEAVPLNAERYLFCAGILRPKTAEEQTAEEIEEGHRVNFLQIKEDCERIFKVNRRARVCVIGSESAYRGSYDGTYAWSKQLLHEYVQTKPLGTRQQLVCISPCPIQDAGQHARRKDRFRTEQRRLAHPQQRFLKAYEVARLVKFLLYEDGGYITGIVIRMNGGEHIKDNACQRPIFKIAS